MVGRIATRRDREVERLGVVETERTARGGVLVGRIATHRDREVERLGGGETDRTARGGVLVGRIATRRDREVERLGGGEIEGDGVLVDRPVFWSGEAETARLNRVLVGRGGATF